MRSSSDWRKSSQRTWGKYNSCSKPPTRCWFSGIWWAWSTPKNRICRDGKWPLIYQNVNILPPWNARHFTNKKIWSRSHAFVIRESIWNHLNFRFLQSFQHIPTKHLELHPTTQHRIEVSPVSSRPCATSSSARPHFFLFFLDPTWWNLSYSARLSRYHVSTPNSPGGSVGTPYAILPMRLFLTTKKKTTSANVVSLKNIVIYWYIKGVGCIINHVIFGLSKSREYPLK